MRSTAWKEMAELGGIAAIIIGLVLVYSEIQQNGVIARAELASGTIEFIDGIYEALSEAEFAALYLKGVNSPADLTQSERFQLNAFYERVIALLGREIILFDLGVFGERNRIPSLLAPRFFASGYGEIWWNTRKETLTLSWETVDEALSELNGTDPILEFDQKISKKISAL